MTGPVTLEAVYTQDSFWIKEGSAYRGVLCPPVAPGDAWEIWNRGEWIPHRFASWDEALAALGITQQQEQEAA